MTSENNYFGADTDWVDLGAGTRAFLAKPKRHSAPFGAVILGHERYGLVQHTLDLTAKFASYGYVAVAPDMASHWDGDKAALNRGEVGLTLTNDEVRRYYGQSLDYLLELPNVDSQRIAAMGVCQSGGYPLLLNSIRKEICANVIFYGGNATSEEILADCTAPILGIWGEKDHVVSVEQLQEFRGKLERLRKSYDFKLYPDSPHGWLNDTMPGRYRQPESEAAWAYAIDFLNRVHQGEFPAGRARWSFTSDIDVHHDHAQNVRLE